MGDHSYHPFWANSPNRNFDILLIYFGTDPEKYKQDADYYLQTSGLFKFENIRLAHDTFRGVIKDYEAIWLPDNDILTDTDSINRLFNLFNELKLDLAQPAIALESQANWTITIQNIFCELRYVNFVETMCPLFNIESFNKVLDTFTLVRSGWGLDFLWPQILKGKKIAIIDSIAVFHKSNHKVNQWLGENCHSVQTKANVNAFHDWEMIMSKYGLDYHFCEYKKIRRPFSERWIAGMSQLKRLLTNPRLLIRLFVLNTREIIKWGFPKVHHG